MPLARSLSLILCIQRHHRPGPHWNVRGIGIKMGIGMRTGMRMRMGIGIGKGMGIGVGNGMGIGMRSGMGMGMGIGIWMRMGSGMEIGMQIGLGIDSVWIAAVAVGFCVCVECVVHAFKHDHSSSWIFSMTYLRIRALFSFEDTKTFRQSYNLQLRHRSTCVKMRCSTHLYALAAEISNKMQKETSFF